MVPRDDVDEREPPGVVQAGPPRRPGHDVRADRHMADQAPLVGGLEGRGQAKGPRVTDVVHERPGQEQVGIEARVPLGERLGERGDADRVLDQATEVGVVPTRRARHRAPGDGQVLVAGEGGERRSQTGIGDLVRKVQHEPPQLLRITMAPRQKVLGGDILLGGPDVPDQELTSSGALAHPPRDPDAVALGELRAEEVGLVEHDPADRAAAVGQGEREEGGALAREASLLAPNRVHALDRRAVAHPRDRADLGGGASAHRSCAGQIRAKSQVRHAHDGVGANRRRAMSSAVRRATSRASASSFVSGLTGRRSPSST